MFSLSCYAAFLVIKKIIQLIRERREKQKIYYYYKYLNKDNDNISELARNKSLLRSISFVGFGGRNNTNNNNNDKNIENTLKTLHIPEDLSTSNKVKKIVINKIDEDIFSKNNYLFKNFDKNYYKSDSDSALINLRFINKLKIIWDILIPNLNNKNSYMLMTQIGFLIMRTYLSVLITKLDAQILKDLINVDLKRFSMDLVYWFLVAFPSSYVNSGIKFLEKKLSLNFRTNLIRYIHELYLNNNMVFYKTNAFAFDQSKMENIDQFITADVTKFCDFITSLISNLGKPIIDLIIFTIYLRDNLGNLGLIGLFLNYSITGLFLKRKTPDFGKFLKSLSKIEGEYFNYHLNLISNSEEISFYNGLKVEKGKILKIFQKLMSKIADINLIKLSYNALENYILKIYWNCSGYMFAALPILVSKNNLTVDSANSIRNFITNKRLIFSLSDSGSRLIYSMKDISTLSGYTDRIFDLLKQLHLSNSHKFNYNDKYFNDINGTIQKDYNGLRFEKISVIVPSREGSNGDKLINKLSFEITENDRLLVMGTNGSGKTSIERIIAELWPVYTKGLLSKPNDEDIMYLPQVPYFLQNASLRDQIIYPLTEIEFLEKGYRDEDLIQLLDLVQLDYLVGRLGEKKINAIQDWNGVLSGGEKQKLNFARILFRNPKMVILDDATNALSNDAEDYLYELLISKKIAFISLSHRPLLIKYHNHLLQIFPPTEADLDSVNNNLNWKFEKIISDEKNIDGTVSGKNYIDMEIKRIEKVLNCDQSELVSRLQKITDQLNDTNDDEDEKPMIFYDMYQNIE